MGLYNENPRKIVTKHPTCVDVGECRPPHRGGKNTRHWCKGRVGIPHTWEWLRQRDDIERELRLGLTYNRITEVPVCFGCNKIDFKHRHYCRRCGEPWSTLRHVPGGWMPCSRCGVAWMTRHKTGGQWAAAGSVVR